MLHGMGPFIKSVASYVCTQIICFYSSLLLNACRDHVDYVYFVTSEIFDNIKYPDSIPLLSMLTIDTKINTLLVDGATASLQLSLAASASI